jgi:glycosyltransferase involved in cell wall biosynthesis
VADREANILNKDMGFDKAIGVPLGVDTDFYGEFYGKIRPIPHTVAFLGAMSVAHNESGAIHFIKDILPLIVNEIPDVKFVVIGGGITDNLKAVANGNTNVVLTGRVADVRNVLGECEVFVCPLTFGSGIKTKNLEAMAMGIPVVTTSIGAENINAVQGRDWIVADDNQEFASQIIRLMTDHDLHDSIIVNAKEFVSKNFTWKVAEERLKECIC